ncbi:Ig-like domain-containing protein [Desulfobotulus sp.]|jgi:hypothetical protein|uniref:Ig-like domain-containing protein n=1 Tax=Desulfobotulus sp. TaxID=1940337 RepID=UPI002A368FAB|nr:invasin domain 3-containing protein [Desulfobotulus sp.]MDY0162729.1 invasin domain 3-containing protein [Desulfobotulus sp.]
MTAKRFKFLAVLFLMAFLFLPLAGCGDDGGSKTGTDTSGGGTPGSDSKVVSEVTVTMGASQVVADGSSNVVVRASVKNAAGVGLQGVRVDFHTTQGTLSSATATTGTEGIATVQLTSGTRVGTAVITASAEGVVKTGSVTLVAGTPDKISVTAAQTTINAGETSVLTARVTDSHNNPVPGETLRFSIVTNPTIGGTLSAVSGATDADGEVRVTYTAGLQMGTEAIRFELANNDQISRDITVNVNAEAPRVSSVTLTLAESSIVADGVRQRAVRAVVLDTQNRPIPGLTVRFSTTLGTLVAQEDDTDASGVAEVMLRAPVRTGIAQVEAWVSGYADEKTVTFIPGPPDNTRSLISVQPASIPADGVSEATVTIVLADAHGNPIEDGTNVRLYASSGTVIENNLKVASGRVAFKVRSANTPGAASLSLADYPAIASASLGFGTLGSQIPASIRLISISNDEIAVTGVGRTDNAGVTVQLVDETGIRVPDVAYNNLRIAFLARPSGGEMISGENASGTLASSTDAISIITKDGYANFNLRAGTLPGIVEIQVEAVDAVGASLNPRVVTVLRQISIASGPAHTIALSTVSRDAIVNLNDGPDNGLESTPGFYSRKLGLIVTDRYGNAVPDGTIVNLGVLDSVIASGVQGRTRQSANLREFSHTDGGVNLATASVLRNGINRMVEANDRLVIFNARAEDKSRFVAGNISSGSLDVQRLYANGATGLRYAMGASLLGGMVYGIDKEGAAPVATKGTVKTKHGLAELRLVYPANTNTIHLGANPAADTRHQPVGSARLIFVATSSDESASLVDEGTLVFSSILPWELRVNPKTIQSSTQILLGLEDGGDDIPLPFVTIVPQVEITKGAFAIQATACTTGISGTCVSTVTIGPGALKDDTANITYFAGDAEVTVTYRRPDEPFWQLTVAPTNIAGSRDIVLTLTEGGTPIPGVQITSDVEMITGDFHVTAPSCVTNALGSCTSRVAITGADPAPRAAVITFTAGSAEAAVVYER